ncbi:MAG TPA: LutB/LldF family L-lactate oxidation iron-sulfur protein, partial [Polyangiaceae bacterium]
MMLGTEDLGARADDALSDAFLRKAVRFTVERLRDAKARGEAALGNWEAWRERGRAVREHVVQNLDYYLQQFADNVAARGGRVHFADDADEAARIALGVVREHGGRLVAKSKSMVSEEIGLNHVLEAEGIECVETDLGEWIVQLAKETPSHIILPAIHKNRGQIKDLFEAEGGTTLGTETRTLAGHARRRLREKFRAADVGMSGCNFAVAETGSVVLFTNEGNGRMVTTMPRTHMVVMGMERIVPSLADVELFANLLPRSATGQKLTTYMNIISGPRREGEVDGPSALEVIVIDNGRSRQLGDPHFQAILHCIRCGACLNVCPVYRQIGGHAYGSVYPGPIGAVLTPLLRDEPRAAELANASSLCGACYQACPVKIPLHDMLVELRRRNVERGETKETERAAFSIFAAVMSRPWLYRLALRVSRRIGRLFGARGAKWLGRLPGVSGWARHRSLPVLQGPSFR